MKKEIVLSAIALLSLMFTNAQSQKKWSVDFRPGVNFATKDLGDANLKTGFGLEGSLTYSILPYLGAYAGWSWNHFASEQSFMGSNIDFEETGYCLGAQFTGKFKSSTLGYMIKGGGTYNHIETENSNGDIVNDSGHGLGWQLGIGLTVPMGKNWMLVPDVRYRSLARTIGEGDGRRNVQLNYISTGVGISYKF
jgi:hypothetical protein